MSESPCDMRWQILCASPSNGSSEFAGTVILVLESGDEGVYGVIINREAGKRLKDFHPEYSGEAIGECKIYDGGPDDKKFLSMSANYVEDDNIRLVFGITPGRLKKILKTDPDAQVGIFDGCTSIDADTLEDEIGRGLWFFEEVGLEYLMAPLEDKWAQAIRAHYSKLLQNEGGCDERNWTFIAASPNYSGPEFEEAVIMLMDEDENGSRGVIINKPEYKKLGELKPEFAGKKIGEFVALNGGPSDKDAVIYGASYAEDKDNISFSLGIPFERAAEMSESDPTTRGAAIFGHVEWAPGQLQAEIDDGMWFSVETDMNKFLTLNPEDKWPVLALIKFPQFRKLKKPSFESFKSLN